MSNDNPPLTPEDVAQGVEAVRVVEMDDEYAHELEDDLYQKVLLAIADGRCADPAACAREALKTKGMDFSRWCA